MNKIAVILVLLVASYCAFPQGHASRTVLSSDNAMLQRHDDDAALNATRKCKYLFEVQTGEMRWAGTDSTLTFTFTDAGPNKVEATYDGGPQGFKNFFERGQYNYDEYTKDFCMKPCRLKIETDGHGAAPAWYCEWVKMSVSGRYEDHWEHRFIVQQWISPFDPYPDEITIDDCNTASMAAVEKKTSPFSII